MKDIERMLRKGGAERSTPDLAERAATEGLLDVAYGTADSPFGPLILATTRRGLARLAYPNEHPDDVLEELVEISPRVLEAQPRVDDVRRQLDEYFDGRRTRFDVRVDWSLTRGGFFRKVLQATNRIPFGRVSTYTEMAVRAGSPRASRAAGNALGSNPIPIVVPCHRVLHTGGGLGGYTGGLERKELLLRLEGVLEPG